MDAAMMRSANVDWQALIQTLGPVFGVVVGLAIFVVSAALLVATILMPFVVWSIRDQVRALRRLELARDERQIAEARALADKLNALIAQGRAAVDELKPIREALSEAKVERVAK